jgi:hypothetical protein
MDIIEYFTHKRQIRPSKQQHPLLSSSKPKSSTLSHYHFNYPNIPTNTSIYQQRPRFPYQTSLKFFRMQFTIMTIATLALSVTALPTWAVTSPVTSVPNVRIQLNGISGEDATQHEVPADGSAFSLNGVSEIFSASIVDAEGLRFPSCQVFSDLRGLVSASEISFTENGDTILLLGSFGTVSVGSVRCSHQ